MAASIGLIALYGFGLFGLLREDTRELFKALTPFTLMASAVIVLGFQKKWTMEFFYFLLGVFVIGWGVHLLGLETAFPFGNYEYGPSLGITLWNTPLMMGLIWVIFIYCAGAITRKIPLVKAGKALIGAWLVVLMDFALEPVAIRFDFWSWYGREVPIFNYVAWFVISFIMLLVFHLGHYRKSNLVAPALYITMLLFFTALNALN